MIKPNRNNQFKQNVKPLSKGRQICQNKRLTQTTINAKPLFPDCNGGTNFNRQYVNNQNADGRLNKLTSTNLDTKDRMQTRAFSQIVKNTSTKIDVMEFNELSQNNLTSKQKSNKKQQQPCQNYFLRKTIFYLFTFFSESPFVWDVNGLTYRQLLAILKELKYIRYGDQQSYSARQVSEQLKKCYYLFISISRGKTFSLLNLIIALCCLQNLAFDPNLIQDIIQQLSQQLNDNKKESNYNDSKYIFFTKKQPLTFQNGVLKPTPKEIAKIQHSLKCFRDTKMMSNSTCLQRKLDQARQQPPLPLLSKKSKQLAGNRRQKMLEEIKRCKPQIQQIELHHILSYKEDVAVKVEAQSKSTTKQWANGDKILKKKLSQKDFKFRNCKHKQSSRLLKPQHSFPHQNQPTIKFPTENNQQSANKMEIIDQLEWQQIPKPLEDITFQNQLLNFKDDFKVTITQQTEKQKKRRQYLQLPILYVDVNIEEGKKERIVIYQGDKALDLAVEFCKKHCLASETVGQLEVMLQQQIGSVLTKIEEAIQQDCSYLY